MTRSDIDNDLSRLLGPDAIPDEERSSALARLAADDEAMSQAADAAAVLRELEAEDGIVVVDETADDEPPRVRDADPAHDPKVVPLPPPSTRRTWRRPPARWLALAAVLVAALLVLPPRFGGRGPVGPGEIAASLTNRQDGLPEDWPPAWRSMRSGSGVVAADDNALAARLGALHMQLELAVAARQTDKIQVISGGIARLLGAVTAGGTVSPIYAAIAAGDSLLPQDSLVQLLADGREYLPQLVGEEHFALGAWAEAARLAARQRDAEFFRARTSRRMLDRAASLPSLDDMTLSMDALRAASHTDAEPDWPELEGHATRLLGHLADGSYSGTSGE